MIINWYRVTIIIMHYIMLSISSKDGYILEYQPDQLKNNPQVIGTLFDKVFFGGFSSCNNIKLDYNGITVYLLNNWIINGVISCDILNPDPEFLEMLDYVAGQNEYLNRLVGIMQYGAMDLIGRKLRLSSSHICKEKKINIFDLHYMLPCDNNIANNNMNIIVNMITPTILNYVSRKYSYFGMKTSLKSANYYLNIALPDLFSTEKRSRGIYQPNSYRGEMRTRRLMFDHMIVIDINPGNVIMDLATYHKYVANKIIEEFNSQ
ncbi:hypothetical protein CE11_00893 [Megavirus courdo11]|uniref:DUF5866 domain-containing protein n=1 Tax=Megavirus courdo11 TaxID=1128140 RepID=K7YHU3_9VIRU|nr:hypothetical protein CE11_00893 [Megavirus courdo11]